AVVVVGAPGMKGVHSLAGLLRDLLDAGVAPGRLVPVVNRAPRSPRARADLAATLAALLQRPPALPGPVPVPERKVDEATRDGLRLPGAVVDPLMGALRAVLDRQADAAPAGRLPERVAAGQLGSWWSAEEAAAD
ncbi:MAG: hypothetical protein ACRDY0_10045, partial [Acidimicrobiales bacterium]